MTPLLWLEKVWPYIALLFGAWLLLYRALNWWAVLITWWTTTCQRFSHVEKTLEVLATNHLPHIEKSTELTVVELQRLHTTLSDVSEYMRLLVGQRIEDK